MPFSPPPYLLSIQSCLPCTNLYLQSIQHHIVVLQLYLLHFYWRRLLTSAQPSSKDILNTALQTFAGLSFVSYVFRKVIALQKSNGYQLQYFHYVEQLNARFKFRKTKNVFKIGSIQFLWVCRTDFHCCVGMISLVVAGDGLHLVGNMAVNRKLQGSSLRSSVIYSVVFL